ncbi:MAG TPA: M1 family aminopeptidase [Gemmatimonadaceae bacterium]|nr:M1 family aminopeptidase [Gemmatimonadaceae bacterium]
MRTPRIAIALVALTAACAKPEVVPEAPAPAVPDSMRSYGVPSFRDGALVSWGAPPPGVVHEAPARTIDLKHQSVRVRFDWERRAVIGSTTLRVAPHGTERVDTVVLDALGMKITEVRDGAGRTLPHEYDGRKLRIPLRTPATAKRSASVRVSYETERPRGGAYFVERRHIVWTHGEPNETAFWVPTVADPSDKTTWEIVVRTPAGERALASGRQVSRRRIGRNIEWRYALDKPAPTYLMSVVTGKYAVLGEKAGRIPLGYWTYEDSTDAARRAFAPTSKMLALLANETGVAYPWRKYDQIVVPDFTRGGMENVSSTTLADDAVLMPDWAAQHLDREALLAHELAHQWFGNLVTMRGWNEAWLSEGFARFFEARWAEVSRPNDAAWMRAENIDRALAADIAARRPLVYDRYQNDPVELFRSGHAYAKGAVVLHMLRRELGDSLFRAGLRAYTEKNAFGTVDSDALKSAFESATGRDLSRFFAQWVKGAGYPAFQVSWSHDASTRKLTLRVKQVQPRDSLTPLFDVAVDVDAYVDNDRQPRRWSIRVSAESASFTFDSVPPIRWVTWDAGDHLLDVTDFPRSTAMLAQQLQADEDVLSRREALLRLAERGNEPIAVRAMDRALRLDEFWGIRKAAVAALSGVTKDTVARNAILDATHDRDARVREAAARALVKFPGEFATARSRIVALSDASMFVRAAALASYVQLYPEGALADVKEALGRDSWLDTLRVTALGALRHVDPATAWELARAHLEETSSGAARRAAVEVLLAHRSGREAELVLAIDPLLTTNDPIVRAAAVDALAKLRAPGAAATLEQRKEVEPDARVREAIEEALKTLTSR